MLTKPLWVSSEGSRLSVVVEASGGDMGAEVESNAGLVVKVGDELLLMGNLSHVMYPGSESIPSGVTWLYVLNLGKLNLIPLSGSGSYGGQSEMGCAVRADVGSDKARRSSKRRLS